MTMQKVCIFMGSDSDLPVMENCANVLKEYNVPFSINITSAHRTPHVTQALIREAEENGCQVFIAAAGLAAHLAGMVAAHTTKPVIGVPMAGGSLQGFDALLSTVQMPAGVPVATVAIGKAGAKNAAILAIQTLALNDEKLAEKLVEQRANQRATILEKDEKLQASYWE